MADTTDDDALVEAGAKATATEAYMMVCGFYTSATIRHA